MPKKYLLYYLVACEGDDINHVKNWQSLLAQFPNIRVFGNSVQGSHSPQVVAQLAKDMKYVGDTYFTDEAPTPPSQL